MPLAITVDIPKRMRTLEKDHRGYPVPFIVTRDRHGVPHFSGNDLVRQQIAVVKRLCHVCGKRLDRTTWFIGGTVGMTKRIFFDGPLHEDCARYSLRVCPYLAAPSYSKAVALGRMDQAGVITHKDPYITNERPERFVLGETAGYAVMSDARGVGFRFVAEPWLHTEWWQAGHAV